MSLHAEPTLAPIPVLGAFRKALWTEAVWELSNSHLKGFLLATPQMPFEVNSFSLFSFCSQVFQIFWMPECYDSRLNCKARDFWSEIEGVPGGLLRFLLVLVSHLVGSVSH